MGTEECKDEMVKNGFGHFRDYTLRNFLEPVNESKSPTKSSPTSKPRKPANNAPLDLCSIKQIFGLQEEREAVPQPAKQKIKVEKVDLLEKKVETNGRETPLVVPPKKEKKKKEAKPPTVM